MKQSIESKAATRFAIRDLLIWTVLVAALCAVLSAWAQHFFLPGMFPTLLLVFGSALATAFLLWWNRKILALIAILLVHGAGFVAYAVFGTVIFASFWCHLISFLVFCLYASFVKQPWRFNTLLRVFVLVGVIAFGYGAWYRAEVLKSLYAMRSQYPMVSIADRFEHENSGERPKREIDMSLKDTPDEGLVDAEALDIKLRMFSYRTRDLRRLHSRSVEQFIIAPDFGARRMPIRGPGEIESIEIQDPGFDHDRFWSMTIQRAIPEVYDREYQLLENPWENFRSNFQHEIGKFQYHFAATRDFANQNTFGYVTVNREVAGFVNHAFHNPPPGIQLDERRWRIESLQLVSLLNHETPQVYLHEDLPRMDQVADGVVETRDLDVFETEGLAKLQNGEQIVSAEVDGELRMIGALRSRFSCTECHNMEKDELLGAFSYKFLRVDATQ